MFTLKICKKKKKIYILNYHILYKEAMVTAYCVKCKKSVEVKNPQEVTLKNNRKAVKGTCTSCGGTVFRIGALKK
jgi:hypothetical protein